MTEQLTVSLRKPRRKRDPQATHERILAAAREVFARRGAEGLSFDQVAERAHVNRSTAYQHFPNRERLIDATATSVSDYLCQAVFGNSERDPARKVTPEEVTEHIAQFAIENPELGCVWLTQLLTLQRPSSDRFLRLYVSHLEAFAKSEYAQPGIDAEVHAVVTLVATFLWPVWVRAHTLDPKQRHQMAARFTREMLRLSLRGAFQSEMSPNSRTDE